MPAACPAGKDKELFLFNQQLTTSKTKRAPFMKHVVRAFVVALVLTGVAATPQTSNASAKNKDYSSRTSLIPVPTCAPNDPNACGIPGRKIQCPALFYILTNN